jgi:endonuclease/exonuclease/phosphatase (EEP) superfamily protein YafD
VPARVLGGVLLAVAAAVLLVLVRPDLLGLAAMEPFAQLIALRGLQAVALLVGAALFATLGALLRRGRGADPARGPGRRRGGAVALVCAGALLLGAAGHAVVLAARGADGTGPGTPTEAHLVVVSFNTFDAVTPDEIAGLVRSQDADVAVLPETSGATARAAARLLTQDGRPTTALAADAAGTRVEGTALLVRTELGAFAQVTAGLPAADLGTFAAVPAGDARLQGAHPVDTADPVRTAPPTLVATHLRAPSARASMPEWRAHTPAIAAVCRATPGVVVAGDLNATLDHPGLRDLGPCVDAAEQAGAAALGTWPAQVPPLLGAPIDHVLVDGRAWRVTGFAVLPAVGGSDHRPVVAHLARR